MLQQLFVMMKYCLEHVCPCGPKVVSVVLLLNLRHYQLHVGEKHIEEKTFFTAAVVRDKARDPVFTSIVTAIYFEAFSELYQASPVVHLM